MESHEPGLRADDTNNNPPAKVLVQLLTCILQLDSISDMIDVCSDIATLISLKRSEFSDVYQLNGVLENLLTDLSVSELNIISNKLILLLSIDPEYYYDLESSSCSSIGLSVSRMYLYEHRQILSILSVLIISAIACQKVASASSWRVFGNRITDALRRLTGL